MIGGHAMVAWPAAYGDSGVETFICGDNGVVYQRTSGRTPALSAPRWPSSIPTRAGKSSNRGDAAGTGTIEATTDRSARDAALVHSDVLRERRCAGRARAAANRAGLPLRLRLRCVGGLGPGAPLRRCFGHDGADGNRFRHGLRDGPVQRDRLFAAACAVVRARPDAVPRTGRVHGDFHLCPVHARLGGPRRLGKGPGVLDTSRRDHDHYQRAPVFEVDAAPRRPSDRQRASPGWRPGRAP